MAIYLIGNGPMQTTAAFAVVASGATIKTMLQVKLAATIQARILEWGISFDGAAAATPGKVELIETGTVFATVTASAASDITKIDGDALLAGDPTTAMISVGTSATGYTSSSEGSITVVRNLDGPILLPPTQPFCKQFPLGQEPVIQAANAMRIRITFGATVNVYCYVKIQV